MEILRVIRNGTKVPVAVLLTIAKLLEARVEMDAIYYSRDESHKVAASHACQHGD